MKIAIVIERADIKLGGAERSVTELTRALNNTGHETTLIAGTGESNQENIHILKPGVQKRIEFDELKSLLKEHVSQNHYDIIHSTLPIGFADIYQPRGGSYRAAMLCNCDSYPNPLVRSVKKMTHTLNSRRTRLIRAEEAICNDRGGPTIAALSEFTAGHFRAYYPTSQDRLTVIPNGIDADVFADSDSIYEQHRILKESGIRDTEQICVYLFAAHNPRLKGLRELLFAFKQAAKKAPNIRLVTVSRANMGQYKNFAEKSGIQKFMLFMPPVPQIQGLLAACDAAVLPTFYDPSSRFILEALAMEKPVITTRQNGASEYITHQRHGWIIENPRSQDALVDALIHYADPTSRQAASQAICEDNLPQKVSIQNHVAGLITLYKNILQNKDLSC